MIDAVLTWLQELDALGWLTVLGVFIAIFGLFVVRSRNKVTQTTDGGGNNFNNITGNVSVKNVRQTKNQTYDLFKLFLILTFSFCVISLGTYIYLQQKPDNASVDTQKNGNSMQVEKIEMNGDDNVQIGVSTGVININSTTKEEMKKEKESK